jgi:hypothetical protein
MKITTIGLDLAKNIFQVHGIEDAGTVVVRRALRRGQVLGFLPSLNLVSLAWRRVAQAITGHVS